MTYISNALQSDATEAQITTHVANLNAFVGDTDDTPENGCWTCAICIEGTNGFQDELARYELARSVIVATNCLDMNPDLKKHYFHKSCIKEMVLPEGGGNFKSPNCPICSTQKAFTSVIPDILKDNVNGMSQRARANALYHAAENGHEDSVAILLEAGSSEEVRGLALLWAAENGHEDSVAILLASKCSEEDRGTSLGWAADNGHEGSVALLLEAGCPEEARGMAVSRAAYNGHEGSVTLLLEAGCSEEARGWALFNAAQNGNEDAVKLLLEAGCSEKDRGAALRRAAENGHEGCVKVLKPSMSWRAIGTIGAIGAAVSAVMLSTAARYLECSQERPEPGYFDFFSSETQPPSFEECFWGQ